MFKLYIKLGFEDSSLLYLASTRNPVY